MNEAYKRKENSLGLPVAYIPTLIRLSIRCRELGYALTVHGSMSRDFDVVAIPWTDAAVSAEELFSELCKEVNGSLGSFEQGKKYFEMGSPGAKAHGRLVWSIYLDGHHYVDLSVMPRIIE